MSDSSELHGQCQQAEPCNDVQWCGCFPVLSQLLGFIKHYCLLFFYVSSLIHFENIFVLSKPKYFFLHLLRPPPGVTCAELSCVHRNQYLHISGIIPELRTSFWIFIFILGLLLVWRRTSSITFLRKGHINENIFETAKILLDCLHLIHILGINFWRYFYLLRSRVSSTPFSFLTIIFQSRIFMGITYQGLAYTVVDSKAEDIVSVLRGLWNLHKFQEASFVHELC